MSVERKRFGAGHRRREEGGGVSGRGEGNSDAGVGEIGDALAIKLWRQI